jgi:hypothetical protein
MHHENPPSVASLHMILWFSTGHLACRSSTWSSVRGTSSGFAPPTWLCLVALATNFALTHHCSLSFTPWSRKVVSLDMSAIFLKVHDRSDVGIRVFCLYTAVFSSN